MSAEKPVKNWYTTVTGHGRVQVWKFHYRACAHHTYDPKTAGKPIPMVSPMDKTAIEHFSLVMCWPWPGLKSHGFGLALGGSDFGKT